MSEEIDILLSRYFSGEASSGELRKLDMWLSESEENEVYFDEMTLLYQQLAPVQPQMDFEEEKALEQFKAYIGNEEKLPVKKYKLRSYRLYVGVAASVALLIGVFLFGYFRGYEKSVQLASQDNEVQYTLAKNVDVTLAPDSQILYKQGKKNEVELKGKATFSIEKTENKNDLLVQAGDTYIKHIGTVFTVTAYYPEDPVIVEVLEGEVLFYTQENSGIRIEQNDKGIYDPKTKQFTYILMKELMNEIIFVDAFLSEVIHALEIRYGVNISLENHSLNDIQITVSFDKDESIENILNIIAATLSINVLSDGQNYALSL